MVNLMILGVQMLRDKELKTVPQKKSEGKVKDDKEDGKWTEWDENGQINSVATYKDGECISGDCPD